MRRPSASTTQPALPPGCCVYCNARLKGDLTVHNTGCRIQGLLDGSFSIPAHSARKPNADEQEGNWNDDRDYEPNE